MKEVIKPFFAPVQMMTAILFLVFLPEPINFMNDLIGSAWWFIRKPQTIKIWMQEDTGNDGIPTITREVRTFLKKKDIFEYSLSPSFYKQDVWSLWVLGRTRCFTWPARIMDNASIKIFKADDVLLPDCVVIEKGKEVYLAKCK